jgi:HTH-type transcriptional regulator, quorum sensing regulator NprR
MTEKPTTSLGSRLRDARLSLGMTQDDLAAGQFSKSYVSAVELGKIRPSVNALRTLAGRLDQPISYFLEEEDVVSEEERLATELADARYQLLAGKPAEAQHILEGLDTDTLRSVERINALLLLAEISLALGDPLSATMVLDKANAKAGPQTPSEHIARLRHLTAQAYQHQGKSNLAVELERKALAALEEAEVADPHLKLEILGSLSRAYSALNRPDEAKALYDEISKVSENAVNPRHLAKTHRDQADAERVAGRMIEARRHIHEATSLQRMLDSMRLASEAAANSARLYTATDDADNARHSLEQALHYAELSGDHNLIVSAANNLAAFHLKSGDSDRAEALMNKAQGMIGAGEVSSELHGQTALNMARLYHNRGDHKRSDELFLQAIKQLEASNQRELLGQVYFQYGQALVSRGQAAEGADYLERAYTATRGHES